MDKDKAKGFLAEFKAFALRGNVMDMAVGIVIGTAFTAIVTALVQNIIMPIVGYATGGVDFSQLAFPAGRTAEDGGIAYGMFIQAVVTFIIIAFVVFLIVKMLNKLSGPKKEEPPAGPTEAELLAEIRDLLKEK
ncbi:MAG: large-conductance mechanosensitive channel protein MscL [Clostridiales Family XIII bacterium]|jgi:large conductance mechanosensitive channel|nr:large-conductance mechanosensitive channel protein MscL [Clostridiales Family XIII bacterium]